MANRKKKLTEVQKKIVEQDYRRYYSVSDVMKNKKLQGLGRIPIVRYLTEIGLYEGISGKNQQLKKQEKIQSTMLARYGVINNGQRDNQGFSVMNKIPYDNIPVLNEHYKEFRKQVEHLTRQNIRKLPVPDYCQYTGVRFADSEQLQVNPNDPRKRTIDHRTPVVIGYLMGETPEKISDTKNLAYCIRYANTIKGNTSAEDFLPIAKYIKQAFIKEGYVVSDN